MKLKYRLGLIAVLLSVSGFTQRSPRIGLTLSGGGAKGLAHIGILKAIDSAGLKIDYITGTSMGSIMGALYAAGYSGNQIEQIGREIDWNLLLSTRDQLSEVSPNEKYEFENYAVELPIENRALKISTGMIPGQEIWLKFQELLLPVYNVKDFDRLSIPFRCIATDMGTGKPVVFKEGEIVTAIRSSMAIPSVFEAVEYQGTKLVDGGIVRNFPVRDAKAMGADFVIGIKLGKSLRPSEDLKTAVDILYQMAFFKDAEDEVVEDRLCDYLIEPDMTGYSAASFDDAGAILDTGIVEGHRHYPFFKRLADSLKRTHPEYAVKSDRMPSVRQVIVDDIVVQGVERSSMTFFMGRLGLKEGSSYNGADVAEAVRRVRGSRQYQLITYTWEPTSAGHANLLLQVREFPSTFAKLGIHYHTFSKVAVIANLTARNTLWKNSKSALKINLSENFRGYVQQQQSFGKQQNSQASLSFYYENFDLPIYIDFEQELLYRTKRYNLNFMLNFNTSMTSSFGVGTLGEDFRLKPKISPNLVVDARNRYLQSYLYYTLNTLDRKVYPVRGWKLLGQAGMIYSQNPEVSFYYPGEEPQAANVNYEPFQQIHFSAQNHAPIGKSLSFQTRIQGGMNFNYEPEYLNFFPIGGSIDFLRNQVTFVGLNEYEVNSESVVTFLAGVQYDFAGSMVLMARANVGAFGFYDDGWVPVNSNNFLSGYGLTFGYRSLLGPIEISAMYSDQAKSFIGYINIGYSF